MVEYDIWIEDIENKLKVDNLNKFLGLILKYYWFVIFLL